MRYRTVTANKQRAGIQALLSRALQAEKDNGHLIAQIQYSDIAREDWAKGLTKEEALQLARFELQHGPWAMLRNLANNYATYGRSHGWQKTWLLVASDRFICGVGRML